MRHITVHGSRTPYPLNPPIPHHPLSTPLFLLPPSVLRRQWYHPVCLGLFHFCGDVLRILHFTNGPAIFHDTRSFEVQREARDKGHSVGVCTRVKWKGKRRGFESGREISLGYSKVENDAVALIRMPLRFWERFIVFFRL